MPPPPKVNLGPIPSPCTYYQGGNSQKPGTSEVLVIHGDEGDDKHKRARSVVLLFSFVMLMISMGVRDLSRILSNIYDGAFFAKIVNGF